MLAHELETDAVKVERWRLEELERAGYPSPLAWMLATNHAVDLHEAITLVRRGCDPYLAYRILT